MASGLVLLIEDDRFQQRVYTRALESAGYIVVAGDRGELAPRLCDLHGPKLVVLDINLPGINGIRPAGASASNTRPGCR
jgi:CheY-like chemotaxis protein